LVLIFLAPDAAFADGNLSNVNHIIIVMQENHSFDNYFGCWLTRPAPGTTETALAPRLIIIVLMA